ncbi:PQQ-binding-like beta-propeller repeat protein [Streptomyces sp. NPDC048604]|uniref:outer membrane protein assembly factor BamB family protein n=1 Tax=Streptomyces sp. NPDC048604 TaxID=3365578 RepID=UPI0037166A22
MRQSRGRQLAAAVAAVLVVGLVAGCSSSEGSLRVAWEAPVDSNARDYGNGAWLVDDTLVRSRYDAVTAFDARTGKERWEYAPPGQEHVCAVSRRADGFVALIARGNRDTGPGCTTVAALDLTTGRELWHTPRAPADQTESLTDLVAVGGGIAVLRDADDKWILETYRPAVPGTEALRAFDLRTGAPRWKAAVPKGCVPERVAAGQRHVVAVLTCDRTELRLAAFAPADGTQKWTVPLGTRPTPGTDAQVTVLATEPLVVQVGGTAEGTPGAYLAFGEDGKARGRIGTTGAHGRIPSHDPARVAIADGRLFAAARGKSGKTYIDRVVAFDLEDGTEVWRHDEAVSSPVLALDVTGGRVTALAARGRKYDGIDQLLILNAATGDEQENGDSGVDMDHKIGKLAGLLVYDDLVVTARWGWGVRPFSAYEHERG